MPWIDSIKVLIDTIQSLLQNYRKVLGLIMKNFRHIFKNFIWITLIIWSAGLFDLLMELTCNPSPDPDLPSLACSSLISLVIALGDTSKILTAVSAILMNPRPQLLHHIVVCINFFFNDAYLFLSACNLNFCLSFLFFFCDLFSGNFDKEMFHFSIEVY